MISSLKAKISQVDILPVDYTVNVTNIEVVQIGQFISNLYLSVGDTQNTSPKIALTDHSVCQKKKVWLLSCLLYTLNYFPEHHNQLWSKYYKHTRQCIGF